MFLLLSRLSLLIEICVFFFLFYLFHSFIHWMTIININSNIFFSTNVCANGNIYATVSFNSYHPIPHSHCFLKSISFPSLNFTIDVIIKIIIIIMIIIFFYNPLGVSFLVFLFVLMKMKSTNIIKASNIKTTNEEERRTWEKCYLFYL